MQVGDKIVFKLSILTINQKFDWWYFMSYRAESTIGFLIARARNALKNEMSKELKPLGISSEQRLILLRLCEKDGLTQKELAEDTFFEQSNLTPMLDKLEKKRYIKREAKANDKRAYLVKITELGKSLEEPLSSMSNKILKKALKGIDEKQKEALTQMLQTIHTNLKSTAN